MTPDLQAKIAYWRRAAVEGTLTPEQTREAILALRQGRTAAVAASDASKRKKAAAAIPDAETLLAGLEGL